MKTPKRPSASQLAAQVEKFNADYPVGTLVLLRKDSGEEVETKVTNPAMILGGHTAVGWFEGVSGCYEIKGRVRLRP